MSDEAFRSFIAMLHKFRHAVDKAEFIRRRVKSLSDLTDLLGADILSSSELAALFGTLETVTLVQLAALIPEDGFLATVAEQTWHAALANSLVSHRG